MGTSTYLKQVTSEFVSTSICKEGTVQSISETLSKDIMQQTAQKHITLASSIHCISVRTHYGDDTVLIESVDPALKLAESEFFIRKKQRNVSPFVLKMTIEGSKLFNKAKEEGKKHTR